MGIEQSGAGTVEPVRRMEAALLGGVVLLQVTVGVMLCSSLVGCGADEGSRTVAIGEARPFQGDQLEVGASPARRFGFEPAAVASGVPSMASGPDFELPDGWLALAPTSMRTLNLRVARDERADCSLTLLPGEGGGLRANIDRWRGQMGLSNLTESEFQSLPSGSLLGRPATRVDFAGSYSGMAGGGGEGFRMVGLLAVDSGGSAFLKFVGPADVVEAELLAFERLAESLGGAPSATAAPSPAGGPLTWSAPEGWVQGPPRMMREVTFTTDPAGSVECYISVLGGDGGGIRSNFDRWRGQMGLAPLDDAALASLERVPCLGSTAILIEIEGAFEGMSGQTHDEALMLGAVASLEGSTVFVKLVGPRDAAAPERERFRAFVASLETSR
ncbi:hypothetical protein [Engelhardtia mirabilis]|uniref:Uncharacterized protein n=1 Tax=Engelhardtia mirabilis TaxID=2528011 RepID=A0A518BN69_9BACT|nr:hypothetical protein Pla133_35250 [Planctomycetes bacterium Pla133]QDV02753.1 hypothetical protein Pla86_35230 [Planctomycetes bacterium Pla86]